MFYILSKALKFFLFPLTWTFILLSIAIFIKDKKHSNRRLLFFSIAVFVFLIFSDRPLLDWARYQTTKAYAEQQLPDHFYPVAVVMGGFGQMNSEAGQMNTNLDRGGRLYEAIRLQRMGIVGKILVSGDATIECDNEGNSTANEFVRYVSQFGVPKENILLEQKARNTRENATLSIAMLDSLGYRDQDCLLITSASHMKRSLNAFEKEGWELEPYAVNIYTQPTKLQLKSLFPSYVTMIHWQELLNEWFGLIAYKVVGY